MWTHFAYFLNERGVHSLRRQAFITSVPLIVGHSNLELCRGCGIHCWVLINFLWNPQFLFISCWVCFVVFVSFSGSLTCWQKKSCLWSPAANVVLPFNVFIFSFPRFLRMMSFLPKILFCLSWKTTRTFDANHVFVDLLISTGGQIEFVTMLRESQKGSVDCWALKTGKNLMESHSFAKTQLFHL